MLVPVLLFILGFLLLIKGGDWFVDGAVGIAHRFRLPELLIGATVVSIGTTLPETMVSMQAAIEGNSGISYGNAIGSVICNTCLIAALTIAVRPGKIDRKNLLLPVASFFAAAAFYACFAYGAGRFARWNGVVLLAMFVSFILLTVLQMRRTPSEPGADNPAGEVRPSSPAKDVVLLVVGAAAIAVGARLLVDNGSLLAKALGVPDSVIGLTMIALGTSLPELVTAITSLAKGHGALSIGNVIGANFLNLALVSGAAITISPFVIPVEKTVGSLNASLAVDIPVMLGAMLVLSVPALLRGRLARWQGVLLLAAYFAFCAFQFGAF